MKRIAIIGGGACGLLALNGLLKDDIDIKIDLFEKADKVGKKILVSGNGRCNFTNMNITPEAYNDVNFVEDILDRCSANDLIKEFEDLGIVSSEDEEGRVYPISDSSNSVLDMLIYKLKDSRVETHLNEEVTAIDKKGGKYVIKTKDFEGTYDYLIIASGSNIQNKNFNNPLNAIIEKLGLEFSKCYPSLTPLVVKEDLKSLKGIRCKASLTLQINDDYYSADGEILFKDNAISGIAAFDLSSYLARHKVKEEKIHTCLLEVDLLPGLFMPIDFLNRRKEALGKLPLEYFLRGMFNKMINTRLYKQAGINVSNRLCEDLSAEEIENLASTIKSLQFKVDPYANVEPAQVLAGGVKVEQINSNFEVKGQPHLYLGGEVLNIDGNCGGFNLHFAFASGLLIAEAILKEI